MADNTQSLAVRGGSLAKALNKSLSVGSLDDLVRVQQEANITLVLDISHSMNIVLRRSGKKRIAGLRETVDQIQSERKMQMITFNDKAEVVEYIGEPMGGTALHLAIDLAKTKESSRCIVISDGEPNSESEAMNAAQRFGGRIDVVFVGDPGTPGEAFLKRLAQSTGGESFTGDLSDPKLITAGVVGLLTAGEDRDDED